MNRELREVRRYWPRAKRSSSGSFFWTAHGRARLELTADIWEVSLGNVVADGLPSLEYTGATIAEAMRAAGFGARPQCAVNGYHFAATRRIETEVRLIMRNWRASVGRAPTPIERWVGSLYRLPALVSTQRPRKGARLGRRKRRRYDIGEPWYGLFPGGDPRLFTPDPEWCTPAEIARHAEACEQWNRGKRHDRGPSCLTNGDGSAWRGDGFGVGMVWWSWKDKRRGGVK